ncbi:protein tyrosine kinase, putative [Bodo saltans]|uniref:Protein tyrosine kinase, putative n=1 Tax=Bodo saltans TaxID=75058 RepID=A0A0S4JDL0_BODSA|nr:protein tyrosine kinase, putative [Bodo saltans]|eukprot:CUG89653.1 protein tyrosine kinase, putative [Bodo saltans]
MPADSTSPRAVAATAESPRHSVPNTECFSRDDERRLDALRRRQQQVISQSNIATIPPPLQHDGGEESEQEQRQQQQQQRLVVEKDPQPLSEEEIVELAALDEKYQSFLDEGVRRLQNANAACDASSSSAGVTQRQADSTTTTTVSSWTDGVVSAASQFSRAAYFWGSLVGTAVPAVAKKIGITDHFDHWNFITDRLILGALPVMTQVGSLGNHLAQLREQLETRKQTLGLVVACLGMEEMNGFGVQVVEFAREEHWHAHIGPAVEYVYLPMHDGTADVTMEHVRLAVDRLHEVLDGKKECAYVHCKAGKGRSWMVVVCYLATYGGRTFENAEALVFMARHQVNPSSSQREFAKDFCKKFHADELARKLMQDDVEPE